MCFKTSGLQDFVRHGANGYTARAFDTDDLAEGLHWALFDCNSQATRDEAFATGQEMFAFENNIDRYERVIEHAIRSYAAQDFDKESLDELATLFDNLGQDARYRHIVRRHLEKELKKSAANSR